MHRRQRLEAVHAHRAYPWLEKIVMTLKGDGHQAVLAGGAVRDALLGFTPKDFDVATSAGPEVVERLFDHTLPVGREFGTIVVVEHGHRFEVTTFRAESDYRDGRRPSKVEFADMKEDAVRRDFTVNALFYDPLDALVFDFVGGMEDLWNKRIRTVGSAEERFEEDHLRMLRAARFTSQLGFELDGRALRAIQRQADSIRSVSSERVLNEMRRLLEGDYLRLGLGILIESGLAARVWPETLTLKIDELTAFSHFPIWETAYSAISHLVGQDPVPRLEAWKASKDSMRRIKDQISGLRILLDPTSSRSARLRTLGGPEFDGVLTLVAGVLRLRGERERIEEWIQEYLQVADSRGELPKPFVSGRDLLAAGIPSSEKLGRILKSLFDAQLDGRITTREQALQAAREMGG